MFETWKYGMWNPGNAGMIVFLVLYSISQYLQISYIFHNISVIISHYFTKIFKEIFPLNSLHGIKPGISQYFTWHWSIHLCKLFCPVVFYVVIYLILFHSISFDICHKFSQKYFCIFSSHITILYEILHTNVRHKSAYVFSLPLSHYFARALFGTAIAQRFLAALFPMPDIASSGHFLSLLLSDHSAQLMSRFSCFSMLRAWSARDTE